MSPLFDLLPALYRLRDAQLAQGDAAGPLESLLTLVDEQLAVMAENLAQLYDDQFIETCAPWVIPYLGDLIGYQAVNGIAPAVASPRAEVAHTISFRRRKGTVLVMEQLARDVTGWGAHAVEFFQLLGTTQYMNHLRPANSYAPDLRRWQAGLYLDSGFDQTAHKVDVRRIAAGRGLYNIQNIAVFLWSLNAYKVSRAPAAVVPADARCFRCSALGLDTALFNNPVWQGADISDAAGPANVPGRLRRRVLCQDLCAAAGATYYGEDKSLAVYLDGKLLAPYQVQVCDLSGPDGSWSNLPAAGGPFAAAIDPELGRIALPAPGPQVSVTYCYGFNADMAGGPYPRQAGFAVQNEDWVLPFPDTANPKRYHTLQQALTFAAGQLATQGEAAVEITGSDTYSGTLAVQVPAGKTLELRAADGQRPTLLLGGECSVAGGISSTFVLNGLIIAGGPVHALGGGNDLSSLQISHCTLVPGAQPALVAEPAGLNVVVQKSILGGIRAAELAAVNLADIVVDSTTRTGVAYAALDGVGAGGALTMTGCTVIGKMHAALLSLVSDCILWAQLAAADTWAAPLVADRKQEGCVRFSYLPAGAITPRQYECVEQGPGAPQPLFVSLSYGDSGYAKLLPATDDALRRGADDGAEMGAFHFVLAPLRETDLRVRMQEYLPVGLEFGIFYEN